MDNLAVLSLLALAPIAVVGILLVGFRLPAMYAMPVGYVAVVGIAVHFWQTEWIAVLAASIQGLILAAGLLYIVFGALLLLAGCSGVEAPGFSRGQETPFSFQVRPTRTSGRM